MFKVRQPQMSRRDDTKGACSEQSCFTWLQDLACISRPRAQVDALPDAGQEVHGSRMWSAGPNTAEMLHEVLYEIPSARDFFRCFLADEAAFTFLEGNFPPWNEHIVTADGELEPWSKENTSTRKMRFLAYPVPPGWVPFTKYVLNVQHTHRYQFVIDRDGSEVLQLDSQIHVQQTGGVPYVDSFTMRQLWTVRTIQANSRTACELHVIAECNFVGKPPLLAPVIRNRAFAEHRGGTQGWLRGARACIERTPKLLGDSSVIVNVDEDETGTAMHRTSEIESYRNGMKLACPWAWLMMCLVCILWIPFTIGEVTWVKVILEPVYPSVLLSLRGLLAL